MTLLERARIVITGALGARHRQIEVDEMANVTPVTSSSARIPRGVLLTRPLGTGKTSLVRALAGEATVPFSMVAPEFVEMLVRVGPSRVRDLVVQAKTAAPAITFIDILDAIGRQRGDATHLGGGSDEREQTLNQTPRELDGFDPTTGVIVGLAAETPGMVGADLTSLANEASMPIRCARSRSSLVWQRAGSATRHPTRTGTAARATSSSAMPGWRWEDAPPRSSCSRSAR